MININEVVDLYIGTQRSWIVSTDQNNAREIIDCSLVSDIKQLCDDRSNDRQEFELIYCSQRLRVSVINTLDEKVYVVRPMPTDVKILSDLGFWPPYNSVLLDPHLSSGLILVSGTFGSGKTWTASGIVKERLSKFGGVAITIEDPPEMPLEGQHGLGVCYQTRVSEFGFAKATRQSARWAPNIIYIGELRDAETAEEALKASVNGRLIIATIHANSPIMAIERLFSLAMSSDASSKSSADVLSLMASGLSIVTCQEIKKLSRDVSGPAMTLLKIKDNVAAQSHIRARRFEQLTSEIQLQRNQLERIK